MTRQGEEGNEEGEDGSRDGVEVAEDSDCYAGGYQTRVPDIPQSASTSEVVTEGGERAGLHGDGRLESQMKDARGRRYGRMRSGARQWRVSLCKCR